MNGDLLHKISGSWVKVGNIYSQSTPPNISGWTWVNQLGATATSLAAATRFRAESNSGQWRYMVSSAAVPATFTLTATLNLIETTVGAASGSSQAGVFFGNASGSYLTLQFSRTSTPTAVISSNHNPTGSPATVASADLTSAMVPAFINGMRYSIVLRMKFDGTNYITSYNMDPVNNPGVFTQLSSETPAYFLGTATKYGITLYNSSGATSWVDYVDWQFTTP